MPFFTRPSAIASMNTSTNAGAHPAPVPPRERSSGLKYSIRASGNGSLGVIFIRYRDTDDRNAKHGYRREQLHPSGKGGVYNLSNTATDFMGEYEIAPNEWCSIMIEAVGGEAFIESVAVEACEKK